MPRWKESDREHLAALRDKAGLSRAQAAVKLGLGLSSMVRYETGYDIPLSVAEDMATLYQVPFEDIRTAAAAIRRPGKRKTELG